MRDWAEVPYVPSDGVATEDRPELLRYLAVRIARKQGELFADGSAAKHFAIVAICRTRRAAAGST